MPVYPDLYAEGVDLQSLSSVVCTEAGIDGGRYRDISALLLPLTIKGPGVMEHFFHSIRVGVLLHWMAPYVLLNDRAALYAGLLHDIGKGQADPSVLCKTEEWTAEDAAHIRAHVERSYETLRGAYDYTAEIVIWHHRFQQSGYPEVMPDWLHQHCDGERLNIMYHGRMLAMADVYDALHRGNSRFGGRLNGTGIRDKMLQFNHDQRNKVELLYGVGVFTTEY